MTRPGPNVTSDADTQPGSDSLFPTGFSGGGALVRQGSVGTGEIADGSVASGDLNLPSVASALAARSEFIGTYVPQASAPVYVEALRGQAANDAALWQLAINTATGNGTTPGTVIAGRGVTYNFTAGLTPRLPAGLPKPGLRVDLNGSTLKLSGAVPRAFDFWWTADNLSFQNIEIFGGVVDANNVNGASVFPMTSITAGATLTAGWNTITLSTASGFPSQVQNSGSQTCLVYFPTTNAGTAQGVFMAARPVGGSSTQIQVRNDGATVTVNASDQVQGACIDHVLIGNGYLGGSWSYANMSFDRIKLHDLEVINVPTTPGTALLSKKATTRTGVLLNLNPSSPASTLTATAVTCERVSITGGEAGFQIVGSAGTFISDSGFRACKHDCVTTPPNNYTSLNFQIGGNAWVGRVWVKDCYGARSGDVGVEIDQPWDAEVSGTTIEDCIGQAFYSTSFAPPASTLSGPLTAILGVAAASGDGTLTIDALPAGAAIRGYCVVDSEVIYYIANAAGTTLTVYRAQGGSTATSHSLNAKVTFHEQSKTRLLYSGNRARRFSVTPTSQFLGHGYSQFTNGSLPLPRLIARNCLYEREGTDFVSSGEALYVSGVGSLDVDLAAVVHGINYTSATAQTSTLVFLSAPTQANASSINSPSPCYSRLRLDAQVSGVLGTGATWRTVSLGQGYWDIDWEVKNRTIFQGSNPSRTTAVDLTTNPSSYVQGRIAVREESLQGDAAPTGITVPSTSFCTVRWLEVDFEALLMDYSTNSTNSNYKPWNIDTTNAENVVIQRAVHSLRNSYPNRPLKRRVVTTTATLNSRDDYVALQVSAPVTVTLPLATGPAGGAINPAAGQPIIIKDESGNLATNNVTLATQNSETIDGASTLVMNTNRQVVKVIPTGSGWAVI